MKKTLQLLGLIATVSAAATGTHDSNLLGDEFNTVDEQPHTHWTYYKNGINWGKKNVAGNVCGKNTELPQSPIDLKTSWATKSNILDRFSKVYTDQTDKINVYWNGHTSQVPVDKPGQEIQSLYSHIADTTYGSPQRYNGVQFHFHAGSEHTVDGVRQDLEMHTVHLPYDGAKIVTAKNGFVAAAMGLMFSVNNPSRTFEQWEIDIIDEFFESLNWDKLTGDKIEVDKVTYGKLMMFADMQNRWTYRGSVTTPPCAVAVYWNVLTTIYPVKQKYVDQFKKQLAKVKDLEKVGNWRRIQPYVEGPKGHQAQIITSGTSNVGLLVATIVLAVMVFGLLLVIVKLRSQMKQQGESEMGALKVQPISNDSANYDTAKPQ